ncbi:MAG: flagellar hook assembly protein FlgD [Planctomycetota bacterium]
MPTTVNAAANTGTPTTTAGATKSAASQIPQDMFLQLFAKQLQYQDPTAPMNTDQFLGQLTQLTTVEGITKMGSGIDAIGAKLDQLLEATTSGADLESLQALNAGANLLGKVVQYGTNESQSGVVEEIRQVGGQYKAIVNGQTVPISSLISITEP